MRDAFIKSIYKVTKKNNEVLCMVGDIGAFLLRHYIKDFPNNFYNLGAAEANLVGVGSGVSYGTMGSTHHSLEDVAIMRVLPNMIIIAPSDPQEVEEAVFAAVKYQGPTYIRLTLSSFSLDYDRGKFEIGKARIVKKGIDAAIIATGDMVTIAIEAAETLKKDNINCYVVNMHTIKPIDDAIVKKLSEECKAIVSIEEHSTIG